MRGINIKNIKELVDDIIERFLTSNKIYLDTKIRVGKKNTNESIVKNIRYLGQINEELYIIRKYATKEQIDYIKKKMGRNFHKYFFL